MPVPPPMMPTPGVVVPCRQRPSLPSPMSPPIPSDQDSDKRRTVICVAHRRRQRPSRSPSSRMPPPDTPRPSLDRSPNSNTLRRLETVHERGSVTSAVLLGVISSAHSVRCLRPILPTLPPTRPTQAQHFIADTEPHECRSVRAGANSDLGEADTSRTRVVPSEPTPRRRPARYVQRPAAVSPPRSFMISLETAPGDQLGDESLHRTPDNARVEAIESNR
jgi:hypothetical protein